MIYKCYNSPTHFARDTSVFDHVSASGPSSSSHLLTSGGTEGCLIAFAGLGLIGLFTGALLLVTCKGAHFLQLVANSQPEGGHCRDSFSSVVELFIFQSVVLPLLAR